MPNTEAFASAAGQNGHFPSLGGALRCYFSKTSERSLVARLLWEQDVGSSNLSTPTTFFFGPLIGSCDSSGSYQFVARRP